MSTAEPTNHMFRAFGSVLPTNTRQFWTLQIAGWTAMSVLSYLSLTLWYNPGQLAPFLHTILQSVIGIFVSYPLRWIGSSAWNMAPLPRVLVNAAGVAAASVVWTILRIYSFTWLTGEPIPLSDWGGWMFASVIVFGSWTFCYHALKYYRHFLTEHQFAVEAQNAALRANEVAHRETLRRLEAEKLFQDTQLRMLKYQLNPHFLFNALNSVSSLVRKGEAEAATDMLARIGDFLRMTLDHSDEFQHTLADELAALDLYLGIEKVRFRDRLKVVIKADEDTLQMEVPSLLLQPLFENSIKFGVSRALAQTTISFRSRIVNGRLRLTISDDGAALEKPKDTSAAAEQQGIGLLNVRSRLQSAYGEDFLFVSGPASPQGYFVEIEFPAHAVQTTHGTRAHSPSGI
ncbi:MAG TPA: histidine kinase [Hyphomonas sp.]|nr:signal transduction protein [Hyphomonas sp.]HRJ00377.1 histidine kinase [Hyphomonas sp.]